MKKTVHRIALCRQSRHSVGRLPFHLSVSVSAVGLPLAGISAVPRVRPIEHGYIRRGARRSFSLRMALGVDSDHSVAPDLRNYRGKVESGATEPRPLEPQSRLSRASIAQGAQVRALRLRSGAAARDRGKSVSWVIDHRRLRRPAHAEEIETKT